MVSFKPRPLYPRGKSLKQGWVGRRASLNPMRKRNPVLPGIEPRSSGPWPSHCTDSVGRNDEKSTLDPCGLSPGQSTCLGLYRLYPSSLSTVAWYRVGGGGGARGRRAQHAIEEGGGERERNADSTTVD
jgi:hypothetical protein